MTPESEPSAPCGPIRVFVSYSHKDTYWMDALMPLLRFPGVDVKPWNDKEISAGLRWDREIKDALEKMDIFVPLISVHFAISDYINKVETPTAEKRFNNGEIEVVPVLVQHPGDGECAWLMQFQRVPPGDESWAQVLRAFQQFDMALAPIRDGIKAAVQRARDRKVRPAS